MGVTRTPDVEPGTEFEVYGEICKTYVDDSTGQRHIVGVATGVREDLDGERVSKNAIVGMARKIEQGDVKFTSSHDQDWLSEIGDIVKGSYDPQTDELLYDAALPPEGIDAIADKAWRTANTQKVGVSIGGKLLKSFYERNELGKKRKVLDSIDLRHLMLTKKPAYPDSFATAVAKTWDGEPPADEEFTLDLEPEGDVEKDLSTGGWSGSGGGNSGQDSKTGTRNAGQRKPDQKGMSTEDDGSDDDDKDKDLPKAPSDRHLACPNCGHEFAADLPVDPEDRQPDDEPDNDDKQETGKMSALTDSLDALKALAADTDVAKTDPTPDPAAAVPSVEKKTTPDSADGMTDVEKLVAASHQHAESRFTELEASDGSGFELVAKAIKQVTDIVGSLPQGRKSVAHVVTQKGVGDVTKTDDDETDVQKQIDDAPDAHTALKIQNEALYGVR